MDRFGSLLFVPGIRPAMFEKAIALQMARFAVGTIPRPANWSGFRVVPLEMEFWQDRPYRLHDRLQFRRDTKGAPWQRTRLFP